jgi:hypothetical protein
MLSYAMAIHLASTLRQCPKSLTPAYTSKGLSNSANLTTGGEDHLLLSSQRLGDKAHPTLGIAIFFPTIRVGFSNLGKVLNEVVVVVG